jgi:hypothetical protein
MISYRASGLYICHQVFTRTQIKPSRVGLEFVIEHSCYTYVSKSVPCHNLNQLGWRKDFLSSIWAIRMSPSLSHKQNILSVARNCNRTFVLYICQQVCTMSQFKPTLMEEGLLSSIGVTRKSASLFLLTI